MQPPPPAPPGITRGGDGRVDGPEGVRERNANSSLLGTARRVVPPPLRIPSYQDPPPFLL